jgi:Domain of unknown function (DUF4116)
MALEYASDELKSDRDTVLMAIKQQPNAIRFASDYLRHYRHLLF